MAQFLWPPMQSLLGNYCLHGHTITPIDVSGSIWGCPFSFTPYAPRPHAPTDGILDSNLPLSLGIYASHSRRASFYLLMFGWAMIFAKDSCDLIDLISKILLFRLELASRWMASPKPCQRPSVRHFRIGILRATPENSWLDCQNLLVSQDSETQFRWKNQSTSEGANWLNVGAKIDHVIAAFDSSGLRPIPGSRILLLLNRKSTIPKQVESSLYLLLGLE